MLKIVHDSKPKFQDPFDKSALISQKVSHGHFLNLSFLSLFLIWSRFLGREEEAKSVVGRCWGVVIIKGEKEVNYTDGWPGQGVWKLDQNSHSGVVQRIKGNVLNSFSKKCPKEEQYFQ